MFRILLFVFVSVVVIFVDGFVSEGCLDLFLEVYWFLLLGDYGFFFFVDFR